MSFNAPPPSSNYQPAGNNNEQTMIVLAHLLGIVFSFFPALIIMFTAGNQSARVRAQAVEALNFQITLFIAYVIAGVLTFVLIGFILMPIIWIAGFILPILAAVAVNQGNDYRYPLNIRLVH